MAAALCWAASRGAGWLSSKLSVAVRRREISLSRERDWLISSSMFVRVEGTDTLHPTCSQASLTSRSTAVQAIMVGIYETDEAEMLTMLNLHRKVP